MLLIVLFLVCCTLEVPAVLFLTDLLPSIDIFDRKPQRLRPAEHHWSGICIEGRAQSPIDLVLGDAEVTYNGELKFYNYENSGPVIADYHKHEGQIKGFLTWDKPPFFSESNSSERYFLRQLHFHWKSEHTFNGLHYPLELHLVHFREGFEPEKGNHSTAVSVVAVLFLVTEHELEGIHDLLAAANSFRSREPISSFSPSVLLPSDRITYFKYRGSFTTPPCTEDVTWFVFSEPKMISARQVQRFVTFLVKASFQTGTFMVESLMGRDERPFVGSARPVQPMNGRKLYLNKWRRFSGIDELFSKVGVITLLCIGMMLVPSLTAIWLIRHRSLLSKPKEAPPSYHSSDPSVPPGRY